MKLIDKSRVARILADYYEELQPWAGCSIGNADDPIVQQLRTIQEIAGRLGLPRDPQQLALAGAFDEPSPKASGRPRRDGPANVNGRKRVG